MRKKALCLFGMAGMAVACAGSAPLEETASATAPLMAVKASPETQKRLGVSEWRADFSDDTRDVVRAIDSRGASVSSLSSHFDAQSRTLVFEDASGKSMRVALGKGIEADTLSAESKDMLVQFDKDLRSSRANVGYASDAKGVACAFAYGACVVLTFGLADCDGAWTRNGC